MDNSALTLSDSNIPYNPKVSWISFGKAIYLVQGLNPHDLDKYSPQHEPQPRVYGAEVRFSKNF